MLILIGACYAEAIKTENVTDSVLRSGYVVSFEELDATSIVDHLKNAILGGSLQALGSKRKKTWEVVAKEVVAEEITHLAKMMPPDIAQGLLIALLSDAVVEPALVGA